MLLLLNTLLPHLLVQLLQRLVLLSCLLAKPLLLLTAGFTAVSAGAGCTALTCTAPDSIPMPYAAAVAATAADAGGDGGTTTAGAVAAAGLWPTA
jgi:hypothetical protein